MAFVFDKQRPLLMAMVQEATKEGALELIEKAHKDGADCFGIQLEDLLPQYRTLDCIKQIYSACAGKPIYTTSYRVRNNKGLSDEACMELLLLGAKAGADLCDMMGDTFDPQPHELTFDENAIARQKEYMEKIRSCGAQVLISSHTHAHLSADEVLRYAHAQKERGADVVKIVNFSNTRDELNESMEMIFRLEKEMEGTPYLFLTGGKTSGPVRQLGPMFGVCVYLCVVERREGYVKEQPILRVMKQIRDNLVFLPENS